MPWVRVSGVWFGFPVWVSGSSFGSWVYGVGVRIGAAGYGCGVWCLEVGASGLMFRVSVLVLRARCAV